MGPQVCFLTTHSIFHSCTTREVSSSLIMIPLKLKSALLARNRCSSMELKIKLSVLFVPPSLSDMYITEY